MSIDRTDLRYLDAMVNFGSHIPPERWGTTNWATTDGDGYFLARMMELERKGLVVSGRIEGELQYWHATDAGIALIGLPPNARRRALAAAKEVSR